ncbi:hypothetical protein [Isoptericola sp. NPDC019482]|uniref:hypothetical protein n=1 Tax=Isoptericola sp. NPDC019482 TaxID=3154688 RepID=UPI003475532C
MLLAAFAARRPTRDIDLAASGLPTTSTTSSADRERSWRSMSSTAWSSTWVPSAARPFVTRRTTPACAFKRRTWRQPARSWTT